ncbi:bombesin receptor subtype-3-like [Diadema antillarum]|uniref:bombesin receptor subtype-3-like n=1 Tax=Diadema antillarum TaxID=105358 RepID=UPI003A845C50
MEQVSYQRTETTIHPVSVGFAFNVGLDNVTDMYGNGTDMFGNVTITPPIIVPQLTFLECFEIFWLVVIGICGVVGNSTLIYSVLLNSEMRSVPNLLIANVAVGDLLVLLLNVPLTILSYVKQSFLLGEMMCKLVTFLPVVSEGVSVFTFTALSFDRYKAIVRPMQRRRRPVVRRTCLVAICIWLFAICFGLPSIFLAYLSYDYPPLVLCFSLPHFTLQARIYEVMRCLIMYVIPLSVITCYYCLIAIQLFRSSRDMPGEGHQESKQARARRRLAKAVLVLVFIFGFCWFPHFLRR